MYSDPFVIADCRRPGAAMANVPLKLPAAEAERLGTSRTTPGRHLEQQTVNTTAQGAQ